MMRVVVGVVERGSCAARRRRGWRAADVVDRRDERRQRRRAVPVARSCSSYFSECRYSSLVSRRRLVLAQLVAAVDAVGRRQRGRQHEPQPERGRRAVAQRAARGCRACWARSWAACSRRSGRGRARSRYSLELPLARAPREVRVALAEADLGQLGHHLRPGERLGEEEHVGVLGAAPRGSPTPRTRTAWCAGCRRGRCARRGRSSSRGSSLHASHSASRSPSVVGPEVDRVDVLVLLRRVLGVRDRAVGPVVEPLGVLADPGVIGRALERVVERDLHAEVAGRLHEGVEVVEGAELGVEGSIRAMAAGLKTASHSPPSAPKAFCGAK